MHVNLPYINLPVALVDNPAINLSLNGLRLLLFLCRTGKPELKIKQDDILSAAKLAGPRHLVRARKELMALGWLKCEKHLNRMVYTLTLPTSRNGN